MFARSNKRVFLLDSFGFFHRSICSRIVKDDIFLDRKKMNVLSIPNDNKILVSFLKSTYVPSPIERHRAKNRVRSSKNARKKRLVSTVIADTILQKCSYHKQLTLIVHRCETRGSLVYQLYKKSSVLRLTLTMRSLEQSRFWRFSSHSSYSRLPSTIQSYRSYSHALESNWFVKPTCIYFLLFILLSLFLSTSVPFSIIQVHASSNVA